MEDPILNKKDANPFAQAPMYGPPPVPIWTVQESPAEMFRKILFLSSLVILMPLFAYFASKLILFEIIMGLSSSSSYFYAAIVAIVVAHIVLIIFIFIAISDESSTKTKRH